MLKIIGTVLIVFCITTFAFIQKSDMFGKLNCTAASLHQQGKLVKIHLLLAPDYAKRSDFERIMIQKVCDIK
jgi:hypothetical protein